MTDRAAAPESLYERLRQHIKASEPVALATVIEGPPERLGAKLVVARTAPIGHRGVVVSGAAVWGTLHDDVLDRVVARDTLGELEAGRSGTRHYGAHGEARQRDVAVFIESFAPPPQMIIFGAVDFTAALGRAGKLLGYRVTVCDARPIFATQARFPMADEVVVSWPNTYLSSAGAGLGSRDVVCVLTHDPKFDVPALVAAVGTAAGYIGAMGSRRTHAERTERLRQAGLDDDDLARIMAPVGLDIGARTPEETAISICAEIIALRTGRVPPSLRDGDGPIHAGGRE